VQAVRLMDSTERLACRLGAKLRRHAPPFDFCPARGVSFSDWLGRNSTAEEAFIAAPAMLEYQ